MLSACSWRLKLQCHSAIMAHRITGSRDDKWYDTLISTHIHSKPKMTTKTWVSADPTTIAVSWSPLLIEVAASGNKIHVPTFSRRLDHYFGCCSTHLNFAETMQKTLSFCRNKCKGTRNQGYADLGSRQPEEVQKIMAALVGLKKSGSRDSLSSGGASQGDEVMAITDSDEERTLPCKQRLSCVEEVMAFYGGTSASSSSSSTSRKLVPVVSVCSSPGKCAKDPTDMEDDQVDLQFHFTCREVCLECRFPQTKHLPWTRLSLHRCLMPACKCCC